MYVCMYMNVCMYACMYVCVYVCVGWCSIRSGCDATDVLTSVGFSHPNVTRSSSGASLLFSGPVSSRTCTVAPVNRHRSPQ